MDTFKNYQLLHQVNHQYLYLLKKRTIHIMITDQSHNLHELFLHVKRWRVKQLKITNEETIYLPKILSSITHIEFDYLLELNLSHNELTSIENLHQIRFPSLMALTLTNNMIVTITSLRKAHCPKLCKLNIHYNLLKEKGQLAQLHSSHCFERFEVSQLDMRSIMKLEARKIKLMRYQKLITFTTDKLLNVFNSRFY